MGRPYEVCDVLEWNVIVEQSICGYGASATDARSQRKLVSDESCSVVIGFEASRRGFQVVDGRNIAKAGDYSFVVGTS